jgi:hypothetical protein
MKGATITGGKEEGDCINIGGDNPNPCAAGPGTELDKEEVIITLLGTNSGASAFNVLPDKALLRSCIGFPLSTAPPVVEVAAEVEEVEDDDDAATAAAAAATATADPSLRGRMTSMGGVVVP